MDDRTFLVPLNGIANTDPLDMDDEAFEEWAHACSVSDAARERIQVIRDQRAKKGKING